MEALYVNESLLQSVVLTGIIGCGCAWQTGHSIALTWRPIEQVVVGAVLLAGAVRFLHFALFEEPLFAPPTTLFEIVCLCVAGAIGWRTTRARQMVRQYYWLYEANGPLGWRPRPDATPKGS